MDFGLELVTLFNNALILYLAFYKFNILDMLILGTVLPRLMHWCLYSFVFETP